MEIVFQSESKAFFSFKILFLLYQKYVIKTNATKNIIITDLYITTLI